MAAELKAQDIRIHVYLARIGLGSRREIESWIRAGHIKVNGKPAKLGQKLDPALDKVQVKNRPVNLIPEKIVVVALFKPRGVVTTVKDPEGRSTVMDLVPKSPRVFPVGRLDLMSEGLLLMTNAGELANRLTHPRYEVEKVYDVKIRGNLDEKKIAYLRKGVTTQEGKFKGAEVLSVRDVTDEGVKKFKVRIKVFEGKNHHVRKMFEAVKCRVIRLKRISIGPISLSGITRGGHRVLTPQSVLMLKKAVGLN